MRWPLVSRRRYDADLAAINADRNRLRGERDQFAKDRDTQRAVARKATEQYVALDERYSDTAIVNSCLTEELTAAREQLAATDDGWQTKYEAEKKRADRLQERLDDALGLNTHAVVAGAMWRDRRTDKKGNQ
ncbi:hypothetical protein [Streptomyces murinus]|uniref:hypothetical protein n=1 Tax=Streptomyces murinus TaxID=33900 RepID=UPI0018F596AA|nr:hypothetical protein [Streptomyces murinus]